MNNVETAKGEVLKGCKMVSDKSFTVGTSGNISIRVPKEDLFIITPTSMNYDVISTEDLIVVDYVGNVVDGKWKPSIEVSMHRKIFLARPDINAIVHTHSLYATTYSSSKNVTKLPPIDIESVNYLGGDILIADFAKPGSIELAEKVVIALKKNAGVLLANHGALGVGKTMESAVTASEILEKTCHSIFLASLLGGIKELDPSYRCVAEEGYLKKRGIQ